MVYNCQINYGRKFDEHKILMYERRERREKMNRIFNGILLLLMVFNILLDSSGVYGQVKRDDIEKKLAIGTEVNLINIYGEFGFVHLTGSYHLNNRSFLRASASIAFQEEGSSYSVQYNYIFLRNTYKNWATGVEDLVECYGLGGFSFVYERGYFEDDEEKVWPLTFRLGNSAFHVFPIAGIGMRAPFKLFGLFRIPNVWVNVFAIPLILPNGGIGIEYRF